VSEQTPVLPKVKAEYLRRGVADIRGWLNPSTAVYLSGLEVLQRRAGSTGGVCEIGIHHGRSFLCLALGLPAGQRAVAIDVFSGSGNVDGSGKGDREIFERNLASHGAGEAVQIIQASSLDLDGLGFVAEGRRFRIFSIDGGHTAEITQNDLLVAERTVVADGLVVLDDVLNRHWLGVITGLFRYWSEGGTLVPAVLVPNKLILAASADAAATCRRLMRENFPAGLEKSGVTLADHDIDVYGEFPWTVRDDQGGAGPLATTEEQGASRTVPVAYLQDLQRRARARRPPVRRLAGGLARRMPWLAARVRPFVARLRSR